MVLECELIEHYDVEVTIEADSGMVMRERWFDSDGLEGRPGGLPSTTEYQLDHNVAYNWEWKARGQLHRDGDKPAKLTISPDTGVNVAELYVVDGSLHRSDGGATVIYRNDSGALLEQKFHKHGRLHRIDGPAVEKFDPVTGDVTHAEFWVEGRVLGPNNSESAKPSP